MHVYLLRHGHTDASGTYTGVSDVELSNTGIEETGQLADLVESITLDHCYCSPLRRCRKTAALLGIKCTTVYDDGLREIDFGRWEGRSFTQIARTDPENLLLWGEQKELFTFPDGERVLDFTNRIEKWFNHLLSSAEDSVLVVSHAGVIRHALCHLLGLDHSAAFQFKINEAALTLISSENGFNQLNFLNRRGV